MTMLQNSLNHWTCQVPEEKHPTPQVLAAWQALRDTRTMCASAEDVQEAQTGLRFTAPLRQGIIFVEFLFMNF